MKSILKIALFLFALPVLAIDHPTSFSLLPGLQIDTTDSNEAMATDTVILEEKVPEETPLAENTKKKVYRFAINDEIAPPSWRLAKRAIEEAHHLKADVIALELNTYGGMVDAADSIRTKILNSDIPVYVLIQNNAASAGALISIACDSIYMQPGSRIGAATVVDQTGSQMPDKYQSYMRATMRATAEETGRNPDIAEAMVDSDLYIAGIVDSGKVLTFTVSEAIANGYCEGEAKSVEEMLALVGITNYEIVEYEETVIESIISLLINPALSGILIMIIIGGIYFELQSPGIGFPIVAALIAAILYFAPLYLEGLADNWEILLFIVGLVLIALEVFVIPGFGVAGISGIALVVTGLALSMVGNVGFDFQWVDPSSLVRSFLIVTIASVLSIAGSVFLAMKLLQSNMLSGVVLNTVQNKEDGYIGTDSGEFEFVGRHGTAATVLRPSGKIEIDGEIHDATAEIGYIEAGEKVVVIKFETAQLFVRKA